MIGELLASAVSNPGFSWICSPACTELEQVVLDWCAKMFGLGDEWLLSGKKGGGIIIVCLSLCQEKNPEIGRSLLLSPV